MMTETGNPGRGVLATLRQFVRAPRERQEFCELCSASLGPIHQHLLEAEKRKIACACDPCAILFAGGARLRYRRIPRDVRRLTDFALEEHEWASLLLPINLAFFVYSSMEGKVVANYPSPGGAMESSLDLTYWDLIVKRNPILNAFEPDVEALLVNRVDDPHRYYRAPIDHCLRLVGVIRTSWRGLSGGTEVWGKIAGFFRELNELSGERLA